MSTDGPRKNSANALAAIRFVRLFQFIPQSPGDTGFASIVTLVFWFISFMEFDQVARFGERPLSLPPLGYILHALYYPSWLLPASAAVIGWRLLRTEGLSAAAVSRYCSYFVLATLIWAFIGIAGLYSMHAANHHSL